MDAVLGSLFPTASHTVEGGIRKGPTAVVKSAAKMDHVRTERRCLTRSSHRNC